MAFSSLPDQGDAAPEKPKSKWRQALLTIGFVLVYMPPLFWLWSRIGWPESFGITIKAHGRAGVIENWFYSYLLLRRPNLIDDATFLYMWAPLVGLLGWLGVSTYRNAQAKRGAGPDKGVSR